MNSLIQLKKIPILPLLITLAPWDIAAGALLIQEAGGVLTDFEGGSGYLERGNIVAGSAGVNASLRQVARGIVDEHLL